MAHSIQSFKEEHLFANDMELLVLLGFMIEEMKGRPKNYELLLFMQSTWENNRHFSGPGTIDLELNKLNEIPAAIPQFLGLLSIVEESILSFGQYIPSDTLNNQYGLSGIHFNNFETDAFQNLIEKFQELLKQRK